MPRPAALVSAVSAAILAAMFLSDFMNPAVSAAAAPALDTARTSIAALRGIDMGGANLRKGMDGGVAYMAPGTNTAVSAVELPRKGNYSIYARVYFPWDKEEHLFIRIRDRDFTAGSYDPPAARRLWDEGNIQVWHWVKVGELSAETAEILNVSVTGPGWLDRIVFCGAPSAWREPWLAGADCPAAGSSQTAPASGDIIFEGGEWRGRGAAVLKKLPDGHAALLVEQGDAALRSFTLPSPGEFEVWARLFFYNKNIFEGRTMQEWQHCAYLAVDGCLLGTVAEQTRRRWTWHKMGKLKLDAGEHIIKVSHRGAPIMAGEVVLARGDHPVEDRDWYARPRGAVLPFGLAGEADPVSARRAGHWLLLGELGREAEGKWIGEKRDGKLDPVEVKLPATPGRLVMELNHPLELSPDSPRQFVGVHATGDLGGLQISFALLDREGTAWMQMGRAATPGADGWTWLYAAVESNPEMTDAGANLYPRGNSGRKPEPLFDVTDKLEIPPCPTVERQPVGAQWADLELTHLVIESPGGTARTILLSQPEFNSPVSARVQAAAEKDRVRLSFDITNASAKTLDIPLFARIGPLGENVGGLDHERTWKRLAVSAPGGRDENVVLTLSAPRGGVCSIEYRLASGPVRHAFLLADPAAKPVLDAHLDALKNECAAYEKLEWKRDMPLADVAAGYGKNYRITVDGTDVTSSEYADTNQSAKRFRVLGTDLSDETGWPRIHVAPGTVGYDPRHGRLKFAEGNAGPMRVVGSYPSGFGVPHCGAFIVGDYVATPGGEGNYSVFDRKRNDRPEALGMVQSWYFSGDGHVMGNYVYFNSSKRGIKVIDDMSNPTRPGVIRAVQLDVVRWGWLSRVNAGLRLLLCSGQDGLAILDAGTDPVRPVFLSLVPDSGSPVEAAGQNQYFVKTAAGLAALDISAPKQPRKFHEWPFPAGAGEDWSKTSLMACDGKRLLFRGPHITLEADGKKSQRSAIFVVEYDQKAGFSRASEVNSNLPSSPNFSGAFYKDHIYLLDGGSLGTQNSVAANGFRSRWYVYRLKDRKWEQAGEPLVEENYPNIFHRILIHEDRAYVADYNIGLRAFDLSDPAAPKQVAHYFGAAEGDGLFVDNGQAYFWQTFGGQVYIFDCGRPEKPLLSSIYWDGSWVAYQNRFRSLNTIWGKDNVFYSPRCGKGLAIIDAGDPAHPREAGMLENAADFRIRGDILVTREMRLYDVKNPLKPEPLGKVGVKAGSALFWRGNHVFLAQDQWLTVVDVSDPRNPKLVNETDLSTTLSDWNGACAVGIAAGRDTAYITANSTAKGEDDLLAIVDIRDPAHPAPLRVFRSLTDYLDTECSESWANFYRCLELRGNYLFVGSYGRIECYDVSKPLMPRLVDSIEIGFQWGLGMLDGDHLYVPGLAELLILKVPASAQRPEGLIKVE